MRDRVGLRSVGVSLRRGRFRGTEEIGPFASKLNDQTAFLRQLSAVERHPRALISRSENDYIAAALAAPCVCPTVDEFRRNVCPHDLTIPLPCVPYDIV